LAAFSLLSKIRLYIEQARRRRKEANPLWIETSEGFSPRQHKIVALKGKLDDTEKVWK
jgi:hypothetical protein